MKVTAIAFKDHRLASGNYFDASFTPKMIVENTEATPLLENEDEDFQYENQVVRSPHCTGIACMLLAL